jgi:hypothetical protein
MGCRGIDPTLRKSVERGQYEVDSKAVAEALLSSWMLVATEAPDGTILAEEEQPASG